MFLASFPIANLALALLVSAALVGVWTVIASFIFLAGCGLLYASRIHSGNGGHTFLTSAKMPWCVAGWR